ncbi:MAG: transcription-repair coupling factor [Elusimicrobia bacterium HGW-Elusimicrobia-4]|nr:MAG: transcription-repair coupling factor [Elusimicrobia bacterium HGW-Elusimicrobia-4]
MLNSLNLSGALAYSVAKNNYLYKNIIIPINTDEDAFDISESIATVSKILKFPVPQILVFPETETASRLKTISQIVKNKSVILCASTAALSKKTLAKKNFEKSVIKVKKNAPVDREFFISQLVKNGYERADIVTDAGEFAVRGEILDVWSNASNLPCRLVFDVSTIETIKNIDVASQRSISALTEIEIIPSKELDEAMIFDYFQNGSFGIFSEIDIVSHLPSFNFNGDMELFKEKYEQWRADDFRIFIVANNDGEKKHLSEILGKGYERNIFTGSLASGFILNDDKIVFVTTNEIFSRYKVRLRPPKFFKDTGVPIESLSDIKKDDFVVHERYGIGIYDGLKKITAGGITAEYISILYADNDKLFVPVGDFNRIQKYFSIGKKPPKINPLDSISWERTRAVASDAAKKMAQQLLQIYSERFDIQRQPFIVDSNYEKQFEEEFIYEETPDQKKAVEDIKKDMTGYVPMERCIFGDTGFGKTEVAMRAALKSVLSGKQVCLLAPTTVLVQQHEQTFFERFADWPVKIATLSRFKTKKAQIEIIEKLKEGKIDIVIGTHRLLSKDISFNNLGLLIIDEEHRFGVADKEKIKSLKKNVDCLYLTATPIPRTLSMAIAGIKNMSTISTPPLGRQSVETTLLEYDEKTIADAIMYEISRGGQVFFVHNKIGTIESCLTHLKKIIPFVKFDFLHGRMTPCEIEEKMLGFLEKKFDCLISTTIIEAGLDIPNVNTIIVSDAENFGLGQLYQLRGRVGRSKTKAYCYLFFRYENLTEISEKRLSAIKEFAKLGSGFRLALKDLQIRGAGEILGKRQHGYIDSIGFDMYLRLLEKHSNEIKGIKTQDLINPEIDISVDAVIGDNYINDENSRISFYKRILTAIAQKDLPEIKNEMEDRFGKIPKEVENLFEVGKIRLIAMKLGILKITSSSASVQIKFSSDTSVEPSKIINVLKNKKFRFIKNDLLEVFLDIAPPAEKNLIFVKNLLHSFQ